MSRYAAGTDVSSDRSRAEIEKTLQRYGASSFSYGWDERDDGTRAAMVGFRVNDRVVRILVPMPNSNDDEFAKTPGRARARKDDARLRLWEQACRQRWRALALVVKAKLEVVESGIATFDDEFLTYIVMPNGRTVGDLVLPKVDEGYRLGRMPPLLLGTGDES